MEENPYHPLDGTGRAASETSFTVNLSALILSVCVLGICLSMGMRNLTHLFAVLLVSLLVFSVGLERLLYPETVALEPESFPDSPNRPDFPSTLLRAGEHFHRWAEYRFEAV